MCHLVDSISVFMAVLFVPEELELFSEPTEAAELEFDTVASSGCN